MNFPREIKTSTNPNLSISGAHFSLDIFAFAYNPRSSEIFALHLCEMMVQYLLHFRNARSGKAGRIFFVCGFFFHSRNAAQFPKRNKKRISIHVIFHTDHDFPSAHRVSTTITFRGSGGPIMFIERARRLVGRVDFYRNPE